MLFLQTFKDAKFVVDFTQCIEISDVASGHLITQLCILSSQLKHHYHQRVSY